MTTTTADYLCSAAQNAASLKSHLNALYRGGHLATPALEKLADDVLVEIGKAAEELAKAPGGALGLAAPVSSNGRQPGLREWQAAFSVLAFEMRKVFKELEQLAESATDDARPALEQIATACYWLSCTADRHACDAMCDATGQPRIGR